MNATQTRFALGKSGLNFFNPLYSTRLFKSVVYIFGAFLTTLVFSQADPAVYPSEAPFDLASGTANGTTLAAADTGISVVFAPGGSFPGVTWKTDSSWNWSGAVQLAVTVTNTGSSPTQLYFIAKDTAGKELYAGFTGPTLEAGKTYVILTDLTHDSKTTYGMNFPPPVISGDNVWLNEQHGAVDLSKVASFKIFMQKAPTDPVTLNFKSILLYKPSPVQALYTGIIDPFGQYTHATWPGKNRRCLRPGRTARHRK